ncbi:gluconokinase (plasmid) [Sinorhizobium numidicum]|uniref:Gluconokinase n=1 Tax=Sinorhizobium numidicum TaxID=680248 RepID=A0ABY8D816_9HYPH|nr:gluconokinase [Sinorhizobium numidicum]WEX79383.1 gluconokinase [Sinorhizobium numidicum]WEX85660.1 gluconokinase [Sinorhizobium numidicum]
MSTAASPQASDADCSPVVVMGVSGCGKSTVGKRLADYLGAAFVEGDGLHSPANVAKMRSGIPLDDADRGPWVDDIGALLARERTVVVSCSALKRSYRDRLRAVAGRPITFVFLQGSRAALAARMGERSGDYMPLSLLDSQLATLELPSGEADVVTIEIDQSPERIVALAMNNLAIRWGRSTTEETTGGK